MHYAHYIEHNKSNESSIYIPTHKYAVYNILRAAKRERSYAACIVGWWLAERGFPCSRAAREHANNQPQARRQTQSRTTDASSTLSTVPSTTCFSRTTQFARACLRRTRLTRFIRIIYYLGAVCAVCVLSVGRVASAVLWLCVCGVWWHFSSKCES